MKKDNISNKADNTKDKAQENHVKMTQTPVPSLILRLSCSTVVSMLAGTTYTISWICILFQILEPVQWRQLAFYFQCLR